MYRRLDGSWGPSERVRKISSPSEFELRTLRRLGETRGQSDQDWKISFPLGFEHWIVSPSKVSIPTTLYRPLIKYHTLWHAKCSTSWNKTVTEQVLLVGICVSWNMFHRQILGFQLSFQENNKSISNNLITLSFIMNEEMSDKNQGRTACEYYVNPFIRLSGFQFTIIGITP